MAWMPSSQAATFSARELPDAIARPLPQRARRRDGVCCCVVGEPRPAVGSRARVRIAWRRVSVEVVLCSKMSVCHKTSPAAALPPLHSLCADSLTSRSPAQAAGHSAAQLSRSARPPVGNVRVSYDTCASVTLCFLPHWNTSISGPCARPLPLPQRARRDDWRRCCYVDWRAAPRCGLSCACADCWAKRECRVILVPGNVRVLYDVSGGA